MTSSDFRVHNWEEMELNQHVWFNGDVMKIIRMPRGPDGGCFFYVIDGKRRAYFDTSATSHSLDEPCYVVEPYPLGSTIAANGLPIFTLNYQNDDSGDRKIGRDSRLTFTAPADGRFVVRVTDTRGWGGERFVYSLAIREPKPDFSVKLAGMNPTVMPGASMGFSFRADRQDNFDDPIQIDITGVPAGFWATSPLIIEAGHDLISGSLHAMPDAAKDADWSKLKITAKGKNITHDAGTFGKHAGRETEVHHRFGNRRWRQARHARSRRRNEAARTYPRTRPDRQSLAAGDSRGQQRPSQPRRAREIGGFKPYALTNPEASEIDALGKSHAAFAVYLGSLFPKVAIAEFTTTSLGGGLYRVEAEVENAGYLPTSTAHGVTSQSVKPTMVQLGIAPESLVSGDAKTSFIPALAGSGRRQSYQLIVRGKAGQAITIKAVAEKGGSALKTVTLK